MEYKGCGSARFSLYSQPRCQTLSKARLISIKVALQWRLLWRSSWTLCTNRCACSLVPCWGRNPNWWSGISCFDVRRGVARRSGSFPTILERRGTRLIGRYDVTSVGSLPGLAIIITLPIFQYRGKYSRRSVALYICVKARKPSCGSPFSTVSVSKSYPRAFVGFVWYCMNFFYFPYAGFLYRECHLVWGA